MAMLSKGLAVLPLILSTVPPPEGGPATAGLRSYARARAELDAGVSAIGGLEALEATSIVRRRTSGDWIGSGQHPRPYAVTAPTLTVPPANGHTRSVSVVDYAESRYHEEALESDLSGDSVTRVTAVTGEVGFETVTYREEKPFYRPFPEARRSSFLVGKLRRHPEGLLRMALRRPETLEWVGRGKERGREQRVISFADPLGTRVVLYFDAQTHLLTKSETLRGHATAGDSSSEVFFLDYRPVGPLLLPFHVVERTAGVPVEEMRAASIELGTALADGLFQPPASFARVEEDPSEPEVVRLGDSLYLIRSPYNVVFAVFEDHVGVFEAPLDSRYAETCLRLIRAQAGERPVRYVVATHFHYDHVAGLRPFVAEGIRVYTTPDAKPVVEQVAASQRTLYPDALSRRPRRPIIEAVRGRKRLEDGPSPVELVDLGPTGHATELLGVYFPGSGCSTRRTCGTRSPWS